MSSNISYVEFQKIWAKLDARQRIWAEEKAQRNKATTWSVVADNFTFKNGIVTERNRR